jgi:FAD binding domain
MSVDPAIVFEKGTETYNQSRLRFFNAAVPDRFPYRIIHPRSTAEVADAVKYASQLQKHISVRSGGHLFPLQHLQDDEILIDLASVNNHLEYDPKTHQIIFGPGLTVRDAERFLTPQGLFFPFGHGPTVGLGGFLMAGGQGWFFPGWGLTSDRWITQMEVVTAKGAVVICNHHEHSDLFWALRGSGMGAFAVVTKFWGRTEPAKKLYLRQLTFSQKIATPAVNWLLDSAKLMLPYHTEITIVTNYSDKYTDLDEGDEIKSTEVHVTGVVAIYADSLEEATEMSYPFNSCPFETVMTDGLRETSWEELFMGQGLLMPPYQSLRYKCDSLLTPASAPRDKVACRQVILMVASGGNTRHSL